MNYSPLFNPHHSALWVDVTVFESTGDGCRRLANDLGPANGHVYREDMRCRLCGAAWWKRPKRCAAVPLPQSTLDGRRRGGLIRGEQRKAEAARRYASMTAEERERLEAERSERKAAHSRAYRAARKAAKGVR